MMTKQWIQFRWQSQIQITGWTSFRLRWQLVYLRNFSFISMKPTVSTLNFLKEQRMRFAGNGELHYLLFSIFYFFSNPFTSVPFLHHFPAIFTWWAQNESETGRGLLLHPLHCYFLRCFLVIYPLLIFKSYIPLLSKLRCFMQGRRENFRAPGQKIRLGPLVSGAPKTHD